MARRPFISGNWKLNLGPKDSSSLAASLRVAIGDTSHVDVAVYPTALSVPSVLETLHGSTIEVGVQDVHSTPSGAFTGSNSAAIAREIGCTRTLVGHSERRKIWGETDQDVNQKVVTSLACGLLPTVCIGETLEQRQSGEAQDVVYRQLSAGLQGLLADQVSTLTLAYEPVWAIGTGHTASPKQAQEIHQAIRAWLRDTYPAYIADEMRILYGGSVKPANAAELLACPDIDGALVGGASLKADSFAAIVRAVS